MAWPLSVGTTPGWFTEVMPLALSAMQRRLECITLTDYADMESRNSPDMLFNVLPFGRDPATVDPGAGDAAFEAVLPGGADVVVECAGVPETFEQSLRLARRGGTVVAFGVVAQGAPTTVLPFDLLTRELRLESAWLNPLTYPRAAALIAVLAQSGSFVPASAVAQPCASA